MNRIKIENGEFSKEFRSARKAAEFLGCSHTTVNSCVRDGVQYQGYTIYKVSDAELEFDAKDDSDVELTATEKKILNSDKLSIEEKAEMLGRADLEIDEHFYVTASKRNLSKSKVYITTSAQNNTPVNKKVFEAIERYASSREAELAVILTSYRNVSLFHAGDDNWWDDIIEPYAIASRQEIGNDTVVLGDLKLQATSSNPATSIELFGGLKSAIIGAPRQQLRPVEVSLLHHRNKYIWATGTVTEPNFSKTKAGGVANEHHTYGFIITEVFDDGETVSRNVNVTDDGHFTDLNYSCGPDFCYEADCLELETLVVGDSHFMQYDHLMDLSLEKFLIKSDIRELFLHDVFDAYSINVHNLDKGFQRHKIDVTLPQELDYTTSRINDFSYHAEKVYVVRSNHDDMLDRSLEMRHWQDMPNESKEKFAELVYLKLRTGDDALSCAIKDNLESNVVLLKYGDSIIRKNVEHALHGDFGANGSRGSKNQFKKLGVKSTTGHTHAPHIEGGSYGAGCTCKLDHGYNINGVSSWGLSVVSMNKYGKRQQILFDKFKYRFTNIPLFNK